MPTPECVRTWRLWSACALLLVLPAAGQDVAVGCSSPPLEVEYTHLQYYSGIVNCGNLFLRADIGGGINIAPRIVYKDAETDQHYTLIMVDPDADMAFPNGTNASWGDVDAPGPTAPHGHWLLGNVPGADLQSGSFGDTMTVLQPFRGPGTPWGSHRYQQLVFLQPAGRIDFDPVPLASFKTSWGFAQFLDRYQLGRKPAASNWHVTQCFTRGPNAAC